MYRRLTGTLPPDFDFPADLTELGYFMNEHDQIRMIHHPEKSFHFWMSKNERCIERHREAMNECLRAVLAERLTARGLSLTALPLGTPVDEPHVPVWTSANLNTCKRLILYVGESHQDLGVFSGRVMSLESVTEGSALKFVHLAQHSAAGELPAADRPGIVIANPGQLLWHRRGKRALTWQSWYALKRPTAVGPPYEVTERNRVPRNADAAAHVQCVFEQLVLPQAVRPGCEVFVIAAGDTAHEVFDYLQYKWSQGASQIAGLAILASNYVWQPVFYDEGFMDWFGRRARGWLVSDEPLGVPLKGRSRMGCNLFSSGEPYFVESAMVRASDHILEYFKLITLLPDYANPPQDLDEASDTANASTWGDEPQQASTRDQDAKQDADEQMLDAESDEASLALQNQGQVNVLSEGIGSMSLSPQESTARHANAEAANGTGEAIEEEMRMTENGERQGAREHHTIERETTSNLPDSHDADNMPPLFNPPNTPVPAPATPVTVPIEQGCITPPPPQVEQRGRDPHRSPALKHLEEPMEQTLSPSAYPLPPSSITPHSFPIVPPLHARDRSSYGSASEVPTPPLPPAPHSTPESTMARLVASHYHPEALQTPTPADRSGGVRRLFADNALCGETPTTKLGAEGEDAQSPAVVTPPAVTTPTEEKVDESGGSLIGVGSGSKGQLLPASHDNSESKDAEPMGSTGNGAPKETDTGGGKELGDKEHLKNSQNGAHEEKDALCDEGIQGTGNGTEEGKRGEEIQNGKKAASHEAAEFAGWRNSTASPESSTVSEASGASSGNESG